MKFTPEQQQVFDSLDKEFILLYKHNPQLINRCVALASSIMEDYKRYKLKLVNPILGQIIVNELVTAHYLNLDYQ